MVHLPMSSFAQQLNLFSSFSVMYILLSYVHYLLPLLLLLLQLLLLLVIILLMLIQKGVYLLLILHLLSRTNKAKS